MRRLGLYCSVVGIALATLMSWIPTTRVKADDKSIVGTWIFTTTVNTPPGSPPFVFTEFAAINPGGTYTDAHAIAFNSQNPFGPPAIAVDSSDAYGSWQRLGDANQFATTHKRLLFAGANTPPTLYGTFFPGQNVGTLTVETVLTLQIGNAGDTLSGPFTAQYTNLEGQVVFAADGTVSATRLKIEPLTNP